MIYILKARKTERLGGISEDWEHDNGQDDYDSREFHQYSLQESVR